MVDLNRYPDEPDVVPVQSDGLLIPGNQLDLNERMDRIAQHFTPYHDTLDALIKDHRGRAYSVITQLHAAIGEPPG